MGFVNKLFDKVGDIIRGIIKDPLPTLLAIGGQMIGIPAYVTTSAITAARGGDIKDIAKAAVASYATTSFLQNTQIGADIRNYTSNAIAGDFTDSLIDNFGISLDTAVTTAKIATASLNGIITGGLSATILGKDISEAITSGFTSGLILSSTDSFFDSMNKDPNWGFSKTALNTMKGITSTGLTAMVNGDVDPATAIGNYIAYSTMKLGASELQSQMKRAIEDYNGKTDVAQNSQDNFTAAKARFQAAVDQHTNLENTLSEQIYEHNQLIETQLGPIQATLERYKGEVEKEQMIYERESAKFEQNKANYENYVPNMQNQGYTLEYHYDGYIWTKPYLETVEEMVVTEDGYPVQINQDEFGRGQPLYQPVTYQRYEIKQYEPQKLYDAAVQAANEANAAASRGQQALDNYKNLAESDETKYLINRIDGIKTNIASTQEQMKVLRAQVETPQGNNLAQQLKDAADRYKQDYSAWSTSKDAAERASTNYQMVLSEIALRDATIDAVNSGLIGVVNRTDDGGILLDNGLTMKDGRFYKDGEAQFPNAVGIPQNVIQMPDGAGGYVRYGVDTGRQMSSSDVRNVFARDYGLNITDEEAQRFVGEPFTYFNKDKFQTYALDKVSQEFESLAQRKPTAEEANQFLVQPDAVKASQMSAIQQAGIPVKGATPEEQVAYAKAWTDARNTKGPGQTFEYQDAAGNTQTGSTDNTQELAKAQEQAEIQRLTRNATGEFETREVNAVKGKLFGSIQMANTTGRYDDLNPADLTQNEMGQMIDLYAQATPEERVKLLQSADAPTFKIINDLLQQSVGATDKVSTTYSNPSDSIKESDLTKYKDVLTTGLRGAAVDLASATTRAGQLVGGAIGLDTSSLDKLQSLLREGQSKRMNALVGDERLVAGAIGSGVTSSLAWTLGGPAGSVALMTGIAANNAWMEGAEAVIDSKGRGWSSAKEARENGVFSYRKLTAEENGLRTAMMTAAEAVGEILGVPAMNAIMKGLPITANPSELIDATRRLAVGFGGEQLSEALTTSMQMAADKWTSFGLNQNATLQDYMDALRDTALATTVAVGTAGSIGTAIENLRNTALTVNPFSEDTRESVDVRTLSSLSDVLKNEGVSEESIKELQTRIDSAVKNNESLDVIKEQAADLLKSEGNMSDIRAKSMSEDLLGRTIEQNINAEFSAQGFDQAQIDTVLPGLKEALVSGQTIEAALKTAAAGATSGDLVSSDALKILEALGKYYKQQPVEQPPTDTTQQTTPAADTTVPTGGTQVPAGDSTGTTQQTPPAAGTDLTGGTQQTPTGDITGTQPPSGVAPSIAGETQQSATGTVPGTSAPSGGTPSAGGTTNVPQTPTGQLSTADLAALGQQLSQQIDAAKASGATDVQAVRDSVNKVATDLGTTSDALLSQLGKTEADLRAEFRSGQETTQQQISNVESTLMQQYDTLSASQKAQFDTLVAQGANMQTAMNLIQSQLTETKTELQDQVGQLETNVQSKFEQLSDAQKAEVDARVKQGQDLTAAITAVGTQTASQLAQTETALKEAIEQLGTDVQGQFDQMSETQKAEVAARVKQGEQLTTAIEKVGQETAQQIAKTEADLQAAIGQLGTNVQQQFSQMDAAQKAEVAARVQQGQDLQTAIQTVGQQVTEQIAQSELGLRAAIGQLGTDVQGRFDQMTEAQKAEVDARVKQGEDLKSAITAVGTQTASQIETATTDLRNQIGKVGAEFQTKFDEMNAAQQQEVAERIKMGQSIDSAINTVGARVTEVGEKLTLDIEGIRKEIAAENQRKAAAEKAAASKAQQEQLLQKAAQNIAVPGAGGATGDGAPTPSPQMRSALTTGEAPQAKFEGPLEEFMKKVEQTSYTQPAGQPMQQPQQTQQPTAQQPTQVAQQGPNYYSYGVFNEIDSILNPLQNMMPSMFAKEGGLAVPLMAKGGLNVVHHSGKERLDFRQGAAVSGPGDGQSDDIPAMLADGEFVFPADVVAALGNGSTKAGSDKLYDMMHSIRAYHRSAKPQDLPPPAKKSPLDYLKKARR